MMPYVIISNQVRLDVGPTFVGDEWSDPVLMEFLDASLIKQLGNNYAQYKTDLPPRKVLNRLETKGYRLITVTGVGQTCIWTLHKEASACQNGMDGENIDSSSSSNSNNRLESSDAGIDSSMSDGHLEELGTNIGY
ncbi:GTP cyclohydrolase 1 feedback regulatory protein [Plakobranchus ocellatus]|uniref:GTP cyclohydrolase 1 feedback regulatory protein n=1 Tax=Plakobranchus ocellatus TaxID=259542 RepID=A0AAV3ZXB9_9GAST|nr:GTP cyclohydrolase 1 feedback regulatory protein [Plakobranchus ocellatus]